MCFLTDAFDLMVAESENMLADDYHAAFPFGECHCGCALEENGECPACIQQAIDAKAMNVDLCSLDRHAAKSVKYLVIDCPFNAENYASLVGEVLTDPPAYALCCEVQD